MAQTLMKEVDLKMVKNEQAEEKEEGEDETQQLLLDDLESDEQKKNLVKSDEQKMNLVESDEQKTHLVESDEQIKSPSDEQLVKSDENKNGCHVGDAHRLHCEANDAVARQLHATEVYDGVASVAKDGLHLPHGPRDDVLCPVHPPLALDLADVVLDDDEASIPQSGLSCPD